ncbi:hypothetical protein Tco_0612574 [Tanacetum coccineum]
MGTSTLVCVRSCRNLVLQLVGPLDDNTSLNDDTSKDSIDDILENSSEALVNYLSARDPQWQFHKHTQKEQPNPLYVPIKNEEEEPFPLDIMYPHSDVALSTRGTKTKCKAYYGLRSLGPLKEEAVVDKKPYSMVKVTNVVLGLRAPKVGVGCSGSSRKRNS